MDVTTIIVAVLGSNVVVELIKGLKGALKNKRNPLEDAVFYMLQDRLEFLLTKALEQGYTSQIELKKLRGFLTAYERLNGDDYIHDLWGRYKELELR